MKLGPYEVNPPLMLAPMAGITDLPFRTICRSFGAAYAVAEMTASRSDLREKAKSLTRWVEERENGFRVVQLLGADPAVMADAARAAEDAGADVVDINMGCPAKKVLSSECGSALLRGILCKHQFHGICPPLCASSIPRRGVAHHTVFLHSGKIVFCFIRLHPYGIIKLQY